MTVLRFLLAALAVVLVAATALPLVRTSEWWVRMFDFPRLQITVVALAVLVGYSVFLAVEGGPATWEVALIALLAVAAAYQGLQMWPYTRLHEVQTVSVDPHDVDAERRIRFVASNVLMENRDGERWLRTIREVAPDLVAAVETDEWWAETASGLKDMLPHSVEVPQDDTYGMCLFSRFPLEDVEVRHLVEDTVPSIWATVRLPSGEAVSLTILHPRPPRPDIQQDSDLRDAELVMAGRDLDDVDGPVIVAGDLNDVAWSHTTRLFQEVSSLLDPRVGRGPFSTFHADHGWLRYPLDHVFHSEHFALAEIRRLGHIGGDHFPILVELALTPELAPLQRAPEADAAERDEADEMVEEAEDRLQTESASDRREREQEDQ